MATVTREEWGYGETIATRGAWTVRYLPDSTAVGWPFAVCDPDGDVMDRCRTWTDAADRAAEEDLADWQASVVAEIEEVRDEIAEALGDCTDPATLRQVLDLLRR